MTRNKSEKVTLEETFEAKVGDSISWALVGLTADEQNEFVSDLSNAVGGLHYDKGTNPLVDYFFTLHCQSASASTTPSKTPAADWVIWRRRARNAELEVQRLQFLLLKERDDDTQQK